jgi:NAD(P)-dependent dehydrogenase (short-subunit alcohol dehydrogenase family)
VSTIPAGRVAIVAGGTGGLGAAVSLAFLQQGAQVAVTYRTQSELDDLVAAAGAQASRLEGHRVDVTDEAATSQLAQAVVTKHGRIDALVNCVGGYAGGASVKDVETKVLDRMLALNLRSGYALVRAVLPQMLAQQSGAIVNVAAKAAVTPPAGAAAYAASKAAAVALMDSLAAEVVGSGVRVNSILPSIIDTPPNRAAMPKADHAKWPKPAELARVVLFLCSDAAAAIHGASIPVYGAR